MRTDGDNQRTATSPRECNKRPCLHLLLWVQSRPLLSPSGLSEQPIPSPNHKGSPQASPHPSPPPPPRPALLRGQALHGRHNGARVPVGEGGVAQGAGIWGQAPQRQQRRVVNPGTRDPTHLLLVTAQHPAFGVGEVTGKKLSSNLLTAGSQAWGGGGVAPSAIASLLHMALCVPNPNCPPPLKLRPQASPGPGLLIPKAQGREVRPVPLPSLALSPERPGCLAMGKETSVSGRTYTSGPFCAAAAGEPCTTYSSPSAFSNSCRPGQHTP